ncbi:hypothetical protein O3M35_010494 [Rhynocoris fuscipes]|uniref:Uncharacterized protein n=1 Tax=Rhynocoris fuscipes TaxID=488301 RepID=A0AAW1D290_9HEMI
MEEIYTVHIKCRPDPAHSYPSERAYSSSTVGGLATTHIIVAILVIILTSAAYCTRNIWLGEFISGTSLVSGAFLCGLTGILACKRWYIDRNIRWFFVASIISTICSITSLSLMIFFLIKPTFNQHSLMLYFLNRNNYTNELEINTTNNTDEIYLEKYDIGDVSDMKSGRYERDIDEHVRYQLEIYVHLFLAALVELILSMLSVKIGWKGVKNSCENGSSTGTLNSTAKPIRPDILETHKNGSKDPKLSHYSNVVKELYKLQKSTMLTDQVINKITNDNQNKLNLPLPESQKEYRERIEKFLASHENCLKE